MIEYDPKFMKDHAAKLYDQAKSIIPAHFFIGLLIGMMVFSEFSNILMKTFDFLIVAIGVLIGAFMGLGSGYNKSAELKLRAQELLCQIKMEENTRR